MATRRNAKKQVRKPAKKAEPETKVIKIRQPSESMMETIKFVKQQTGVGTNSGAVEFVLKMFMVSHKETEELNNQIAELKTQNENLVRFCYGFINSKDKMEFFMKELKKIINKYNVTEEEE